MENTINYSNNSNNEIEKAIKIINFSKEKENELSNAINNYNNASNIALTLNKETEDAIAIAVDIINNPDTNQETAQNLIDNVNFLNEKAKIADYEVQKAIEEKIKIEKTVEISKQKSKIAEDILNLNLNNKIDILNMDPLIRIPEETIKNKTKFIDRFELKCPDGFNQNKKYCERVIEIYNPSIENNIKKNDKSNSYNFLIIIIILILLFVIYYRNKKKYIY
jgi:hypothetical protein